VDVNVVDRLAAICSSVDHGSISLCQAFRAGDFSGSPVKVSEQFFVFSLRVCDGRDMLSRDDKDVDGSLRFHVGKRVAVVVLIDGFRRDAAVDDLAEDTAHGESLQRFGSRCRGTGRRELLSLSLEVTMDSSAACSNLLWIPEKAVYGMSKLSIESADRC
jgi:hypothetical protein